MALHRSSSVLVLLAGLALAGCTPDKEAEEAPRRAIEATQVTAVPLSRYVSVVGRLQAARQERVSAQLPERIATVHVKLGEQVRRGDVLITLSGELEAAGLGQARAGLQAAEAGARLALAQLERVRVLHGAGTASLADLQAAESQYASAKASVEQLTSAQSQAAVQSSRSTIRSPIDGVVAQLDAEAGDIAQPGRPLALIVQPGPAKVVLDVPERDFSLVKAGQPAQVWALSNPGELVGGAVAAVGGLIDPLTRTGRVELTLPQSPIVPGSAVRAKIEVSRRDAVLEIPALAVQLAADYASTGQGTVFVLDGEQVSARVVTLGERDGDAIEVLSGIEPGATIATIGAHLLRDGALVRVMETAP